MQRRPRDEHGSRVITWPRRAAAAQLASQQPWRESKRWRRMRRVEPGRPTPSSPRRCEKASGFVVCPRPHAALLSIRGVVARAPAHCGGAAAAAAAGALASPAALRAPSERQGAPRGHGCGEGEAGEQHHHGRGRVLQVRGAHPVQEGERGGGHGARPGPARHQRAPEGNSWAMWGDFKLAE